MPIPEEALHAFLTHYNAGEFWESHEVLEGPWRETRDAFTQGLILLASAWVHWQRRNAHGVTAQLDKSLERLAPYPHRWEGFDLAAIRAYCDDIRRVVQDNPDDWPDRVRPLELVPPVAPPVP